MGLVEIKGNPLCDKLWIFFCFVIGIMIGMGIVNSFFPNTQAQTQQVELPILKREIYDDYREYRKRTDYSVLSAQLLIAEELRLIRQELEKMNERNK